MLDFYSIETYEDGKYINPNGYFYGACDGTDTPCRFVTYHYMMPLDEFLAMPDEEKWEWLNESVKYIYDLSEEEMKNDERELLNSSSLLSFKDLTMNTPDGDYYTKGE